MKYYIGKYWVMSNSTDPQVREEGKKKWIETAKKYGDYYMSIKNKLPKGFLKAYESNYWFHDFHFNHINILDIDRYSSSVEFSISHEDTTYILTFCKVKKMLFDIQTANTWLMGKLTWGYSEFELNSDGTWIIRILCDFVCELEIVFKRVRISKVKKTGINNL